MDESAKQAVRDALGGAFPSDLSIGEVADKAHVARATASTWIKVLVAEGAAEESRLVGNARLYRLRKRP